MTSIDERVVKMTFQNAQFQQGIQQTIRSLELLNKSLQLQGVSKGLVDVAAASQKLDHQVAQNRNSLGQFTKGVHDVSTASQQLDQHVTQNRDSMGRFTKGTAEASTAAQQLGQHTDQTRNSLGQFTSGVTEAGDSAHHLSKNVDEGRNSLGQFTKGMGETAAAANQQKGSLAGVEAGIQGLTDRFRTMNVVGTASMVMLAQSAIEAGKQFVKSLTLDPVIEGFREYETGINSVQTILANTAVAGTTLKDVTKTLDELNHYADQTIYNFAEMAKNIGTFTAAGVDLDTAAGAIKGIANLAAMSGSNSEQASRAMYQLSQAISSGTVSMEDWNSVNEAGMANGAFKRALAETAVQMGTLDKSAVKLKGEMKNVTIEGKSFEKSISAINGESWLTSDVLTSTLQQFTGDLTDADLAAQGFSKSQIKAIQKQAQIAKNAATEVKTVTQLLSTFREGITSGWAETWKIVFGDFEEAKGMFTGVSETIGHMLMESSHARNAMLKEWDKLGGRTALIDGIANTFKAFMSIMKPIKDAFREIFPATTGKQLFELTERFRDFTANLKIGSETATNLKRTFAGVFAFFGIGIDIIQGIVGVIFDLLGVATKGSGGFLEFTAKIGDFIVKIREALQSGDDLGKFFGTIGKILAVPIKIIAALGRGIGNLFGQLDTDAILSKMAGILGIFRPIGRAIDEIVSSGDKVVEVIGKMFAGFGPLVDMVGEFFGRIGDYISNAFEGVDYKAILAGINTGLFAGLVLLAKQLIDNFTGGGVGGGPGITEVIQDTIGQLTDTLSAMQNALNAAVLLQIAIAVGILALSVSKLAKVDAEDLGKALGAITIMFTQLIGALAVFNKFVGVAGFAKLPFVMGSLILLAAAVGVLTIAVKQLADLDWNELAKGLVGVTVLMAALVAAAKFMPVSSGLISTGLGLIVLAGAIKLLASAVTDLSGLSWEGMAKGLVGVGALLGSLLLFTKFAQVGKGGVLQGAGLILLAAGIKILASAMEDLSGLSWSEIGKSLVAMLGALTIIAAALYVIPPTAVLGAAGVLVVAMSLGMVADALKVMGKMSWGAIGKSLTAMLGALTIIAAALYVVPPTAILGAAGILVVALSLGLIANVLQDMATMSWEEIGKAMTVLAGSLILIAGAMTVMIVALPGAAALLVVTAALAILAPILIVFGQMSWGEIVKGLVMLAGVFVVLGAAGLILAPIVPFLFLLGSAIALLGVGVLAAGAGVLLFATALTALAAAGAAGTAAIVGIVKGLLGLLPEIAKQIGLSVIAFAKTIAAAYPVIVKTTVTVLSAMIEAISVMTPKIVKMLLRLLTMMLQQMSIYIPKMVDAGLKLVTGILNGIAKNLGGVIDAATKVIVAFLNGISRNLPKVANAGANLIIKFVNTVANTVRGKSAELGEAGVNLATAIIEGMARGLIAGIGTIANKAKEVARSALDAAKGVLGINSPSKEFQKIGKFVIDGFRKGLDGNKGQIDDAFNSLKSQLSDAMKSSAKDIQDLEAKLKKLTNARHRDNKKIAETRKEIAQAKKENKAFTAAYVELRTKLGDERTQLGKLAKEYDKVTARIEKAQQTLEDAKKTRDDYNKQIRDQYSDMPSATGETKLADYLNDLEKQIEDTKVFSNTLQRLRDLGLNDETYKDLLAAGTSALPFADQLLTSGKAGVDELNNLSNQLDVAGKALGKSASSELYDAAVKAAEGLVKGLEGQRKAIEKVMDMIAEAMVKAIKKKLKIKSPSRAFMEVGGYSAKGLIAGFEGMAGDVEKSAAEVGRSAFDSLRSTLTGMSDLVMSDVDVNPTITPVLDLSSVRKEAGQLGNMLSGSPISVDSSYAKAKYVASRVMSNQADSSSTDSKTPSNTLSYTQNNYSPKALSSADIYRQTRNQLSKVKGALEP